VVRKRKVNQSELKSWIMFFFALALLYGMFRRGDALGPWWTLVIGAMLSLTTLLVAVENVMGLFKRGSHEPFNPDSEDGQRGKTVDTPGDEKTPPDSGVHQVRQRLWRPSRDHSHQVAFPRLGHLFVLDDNYAMAF
jgi:hypothetical protein